MVDACHLLHRISLFLVMDCSSVKAIKTFMNNITRSKSREFKGIMPRVESRPLQPIVYHLTINLIVLG